MSEAYSQILGACASDIPEVLLSGGSFSIVFGGGWGPQSMSGCRLNSFEAASSRSRAAFFALRGMCK